MKRFLIPLALGLLGVPTSGHAGEMRCGTQLVTESDTKASVLAKCGAPTRQTSSNESWKPPKEGGVTFHKKTEVWTYNRGPREFVQELRFENDKLVSVNTGGYGW